MYDMKYKKQQKWYEIRNERGITEQEPRNKMRNEIYRHKVRFFEQIWSENSESKIQDLKTIQQKYPAFQYELWRYYIFHTAMA